MFLRMIVTCVIASGLLTANSVAMADSADAQLFKGKTGQGYRIKLQVKDGVFRIHAVDVELRCRDKSWLLLEEGGFLWTKTGKGGHFKDAQFGRTDSVYFRGRLNERRIRGRVRVTDKLNNGTRCSSRWIPFNATPR